MNIFVQQALTGVIKILIGGDTWTEVKNAVISASKLDISGDEKKAMVVTALKDTGWKLASSLLILAIEVAVIILTKSATDFVTNNTTI